MAASREDGGASRKDADDIASSPSAGNEGIHQAHLDSLEKVIKKLQKMTINSPGSPVSAGESKDGNSEGAASQADLAHSPSLDAVRGRRKTARMDPRNYTNVRRQLYNTDSENSDKASNDSQERSRMLGRRKRQNTNPEGPLTKKLSENSLNLSLNLGQPAVW